MRALASVEHIEFRDVLLTCCLLCLECLRRIVLQILELVDQMHLLKLGLLL